MIRFEECDKCRHSHAVYTCDACGYDIIGVGVASSPFRVTVQAPTGAMAVESHLCGSCVVELAKLNVAIMPRPPIGGGS